MTKQVTEYFIGDEVICQLEYLTKPAIGIITDTRAPTNQSITNFAINLKTPNVAYGDHFVYYREIIGLATEMSKAIYL